MMPLLGEERGSGALVRAGAQFGNDLGFGSKETRGAGRWKGEVVAEGPRTHIIG
jgi:hypothetical protein